MRKLLDIGFMVLILCSTASAKEKWYAIDIVFGEYRGCVPGYQVGADDPGSHIRNLQEMGIPYTTHDLKEGDKIVETTITYVSPSGLKISTTLYRGKQRCEVVLRSLKEKQAHERKRQQQEIDRYK